MIKIALLVVLSSLVLTACTHDNQVTAPNSYTLSEVAQHGKSDDCWLAIEGKVYDVTTFIDGGKHPGGEAILEGCGKDATVLFNTRPMGSKTPHSDKARELIKNFEIGRLVQ